METNGNQIKQKSANKYTCLFCDYNTSRKSNFDTHLNSKKHVINSANGNKWKQMETKISKKSAKISYSCEKCYKEFTNRSGLWKHKQKCLTEKKNKQNQQSKLNNLDKDQFIKTLIEQNAKLMSILENSVHNTTNNTTHTNSHNNAFNLNFFLNETCKNAMNITDFVESIKLQLNDLMEVGELGYVEGISKIIVKNLNNLDETIRPIHCTDKKRETMYIKDENQWEREDENKTKLKKAVNKIADKNIRLLSNFREKYPDYNNSSSRTSDTYDKIVVEAMTCDHVKNEKIIKKISNATIINK